MKKEILCLLKNRNIMLISTSGLFLSFINGFLRWYLPIKLVLMGNTIFAGIVFAVSNIDDVVFSMFGGILADIKGRKPIIIVSTLFYVFGSIFLLSSFYFSKFYAMISIFVATVFLQGVTGLSSGASSALIVESVEEKFVGRTFSFYSVFSNIGLISGSFILALIAEKKSDISVAYLILLFSILSVMIRMYLNETLKQKKFENFKFSWIKSLKERLKSVKGVMFLTSILFFIILNGLGHGISGNFYSIYIKNILKVREAYIGIVYSIIPISQLILQPIAGYVTDKFGFRYSLLIGNVVAGAFILIFSIVSNISIAIFAMISSAALGAFHGIGYQSMVGKLSSENYRATLYSILLSLWNITFVAGPLIGGIAYYTYPKSPFILAGILLIITIVPVLKIKERRILS